MPADAAEERQYGDDQCAGHDTTRKVSPAQDPVGYCRRTTAGGTMASTAAARRWGVHAGKRVMKFSVRAFFSRRRFPQFQDPAYRGVLEGLGGAYDEFGRQVHAAGDDLVAWARRAGHRLAGERRRVDLAFAGQHRAVEAGCARRGMTMNSSSGGELEGIHLLQLALLHDVRVLRRDIHHVRDGLARLVHGVALEIARPPGRTASRTRLRPWRGSVSRTAPAQTRRRWPRSVAKSLVSACP